MVVRVRVRVVMAFAVIAPLALSACAAPPNTRPVATASTAGASSPPTAATGAASGVSTGSVEPTPTKPVPHRRVPAVSASSRAYARKIGGTSHRGDTLYFVVGLSTSSEREARLKLNAALPLFGDMQSYFIVQRSDNFDGMRGGYWIVAEAYRKRPSAENLAFGRRAFPSAYVRHAVVLTSDPIPVYEDLVPK
jgi:hypothetical protein